MIFVVDIGNTNIVCGVYKNNELIWHSRFKTDKFSTSDEYNALLNSLKSGAWNYDQIEAAAISSVVPDMTRMWQHLFTKYFSVKAYVISGYSELGLEYIVEDPGFIGADLIVNALAAWKKYKKSCIIIDFGTATTIQVVSSGGKFMGAIISPGMLTAAKELFEKAALLPEIELVSPKVLLGTNTRDAMLSGIVKGHAFMVDNFICELKKEYVRLQPFTVVATGGVAELFSQVIPSLDTIDRTLTIDGLNLAVSILVKNS